MKDIYDYIHEYFNNQERFSFPYDRKELKELTNSNGLYVLFEKGETYNDFDRIVRIGSHDGNDRLIKRLGNHFNSKLHRGSVFRKHIGRCFLNIDKDSYLEHWNRPFKSRVEKKIHGKFVDLEYEKKYEEKVTNHIHKNLSFAVIPNVFEKINRDRIEEGLISSLNQSDKKISSDTWLGNLHPDQRIRNAKIWNIEYLKHKPLSLDEFKELIENK
ncbi:hypothetical protein MHL31_02585 [Lutibacter sp. A80]|uniref:hypothetical protein n=1 Tax=Lutibacter sp. A80 TaxID=2918453 RepID=UPI001F069624|nr:hypothetical protein [Lutibacter sp. A80]UMB61098.1 hypothetical protein MHL31_02585 [Lutibacter sp. A80]